MSERHLTLAEVADRHRYSVRWLRDFIRANKIPVLRAGRTITFDAKALAALEQKLRRHPEKISSAYVKALAITAAPDLPMNGFVYFIQVGDDGPIKIGKADDVETRLRALQTSHAGKLRILAEIPGGLQRERELQERFARYRLRGEWFSPAAELIEFINRLTRV